MTRTAQVPPRSFLGEVRDAVTPRATLLVIGVVALQVLFIASYVGALHHPKPKDVPFGVVAQGSAAGRTVARFERLPGGPLDPRVVADEATARSRIAHRDIDGALLVDPDGTTDTLLVASGGGATLSNALTSLITGLEKDQGRTVRTVDVVPADAQDANGLTPFYLVVGWCVGGYLCASALAVSAGARPADLRRAVIRLAAMALVAIVGGLGGAVVVGPVLGALPGSVAALWGLGALITFAVGAATLALQCVFGIVGIGVAVLLVVILGNPSAGGALPPPMLPPFWHTIGPALPPGAGTWAARSIAYFDDNGTTASLLILAAWAALGTAITLAAGSRGGTPLPQRESPAPTGSGGGGAHT
ncbi:hypothetical protein QFZ75_006069 [Streptomyces sp. V3I8]|uniref:DUF3533 domain-containing protein n=1 Tax=Streptomyces sp. V3I8 TaxID=3042279 RepID=UPI002784C252|nr:DUF3533 domain-containing protein [Streptomyces sp. V3I8]MDQ1039653.1 hypothetical protein [Streptomyces sp. V3I8]